LREYCHPHAHADGLKFDDPDLATIYDAARQTYRQNTLDVFMDCPSRERAGWLCDSYFTAQAAQLFSGRPDVERVMLENFVIARQFPHIPRGMLPMCYPAEFPGGRFIPQWAMWFVVELEQYLQRDPEADPVLFRKTVFDLVEYLNRFHNSDGLLERLPSWNFIEWSDANDYVQDVNYPTNMLYSRVLEITGRLYGRADMARQADSVRRAVVDQSFDGRFFVDNAIRLEDGRLELTANRTEVCQYYALFFDVARREDMRFASLVDTVLDVFGPDREEKGLMPEIGYANAFIGYYLRLEILLSWKRYDQVVREIKGYFLKMAERTGTLWEHKDEHGSLNHGFASFVAVALAKANRGLNLESKQ
jgi:alpha-L-rhamnosidase